MKSSDAIEVVGATDVSVSAVGAVPATTAPAWTGELTVPWPPAACRPNARASWIVLWKAKRDYGRLIENLLLPVQDQMVAAVPDGPLAVQIRFDPPDAMWRDRDNLLASFKAGIDTVCRLLGIDDSRFVRWAFGVGEPCRPDGRVAMRWGPMACLPAGWGEDLSPEALAGRGKKRKRRRGSQAAQAPSPLLD